MLKKIFGAFIFFSLALFSSSTMGFAQCTVDNTCGSAGGCANAGDMCNIPWFGEPSCSPHPDCTNADHTQNWCGNGGTNNKCGPEYGCAAGFMCSNIMSFNRRCVTPTSEDPSCEAYVTPPEAGPETPPGVLTCANGGNLTANRCGANGGCPNPTEMCMGGSCIASGLCVNAEDPEELPLTGCGADNTLGRCNAGGQCPQGQRCQAGGETGFECVASTDCDVTRPPQGPVITPDQAATSEIDIFAGPTSDNFRQLNPLAQSDVAGDLSSPGGIVSRMLLFAFPLAGLILFVMIVWGGFEMLTGATGKGIEAGRQRVTAAIVGFMLLFVAYWVFQIVEVIFGVVIL